jgi:hypothetical protein
MYYQKKLLMYVLPNMQIKSQTNVFDVVGKYLENTLVSKGRFAYTLINE